MDGSPFWLGVQALARCRVLAHEAQRPRKIRSTARSSNPGAACEMALADEVSGEPCPAGGKSRTAPQASQTMWWCAVMFGSNRPEPGESDIAAQSPADESAPRVL